MKLKEMKARNPKHNLDPIDLTGWEITCTEFIPRRRHQAIKTPDPDTDFRARAISSIKELDQDGNSTHDNDSKIERERQRIEHTRQQQGATRLSVPQQQQ